MDAQSVKNTETVTLEHYGAGKKVSGVDLGVTGSLLRGNQQSVEEMRAVTERQLALHPLGVPGFATQKN
jgi:hypothetical protein